MPATDPWKAFRAELSRHLALRTMTSLDLAAALQFQVSENVVSNWRKGRSKPNLDLLPRISEVLGMGSPEAGNHDPGYLLTRMGLLPQTERSNAYSLAYRVTSLENRYRESLERMSELGRLYGVTSIVQAAARSMRWAAAVWPAVEGTPDCRMHVAARVDLRRLDGAPATVDAAWADPDLHKALRDAYAIPSTRGPRWSTADDTVSRWSILQLGGPMSPLRRIAHARLPAVHCYSLTVASWINDVAHLVAYAIGYGFAPTRDVAMEVSGIHLGSTRAVDRTAAHAHFLKHTSTRRVWSHHAPPTDEHPDPFAALDTDVVHVWLRESDDLLRQHATARDGVDLNALLRSRDDVDRLAGTAERDVLVLDVDVTADVEQRWQQALAASRAVHDHLGSSGRLNADASAHWQEAARLSPGVAAPYLSWLGRGRTQARLS